MIKKYFLLFLPPHIDKTMVQYFPYLLLLMVATFDGGYYAAYNAG